MTNPVFLNLFILGRKMSVTAKISILHRLSGVVLFLSIPFILSALHRSLINKVYFDKMHNFMNSIYIKCLFIFLIWSFIYHLLSGIRFILLDLHKGIEIKVAKTTALFVLLLSFILIVFFGWLIW